VESKGY